MLHYNLIDASEGVTINKVTIHTNAEFVFTITFSTELKFSTTCM